jgi:predicted transposase YbfD/YdcC
VSIFHRACGAPWGGQRDIAEKILDKKADYVLAIKGNQGSLREDVEVFAVEQKADSFTSLVLLAHAMGPVIRRHWTIENSLHWVMDMVFATTNAGPEPITPEPISPQ